MKDAYSKKLSIATQHDQDGVDVVEFVVGTAEELPYDNDYINIVISQTILCFVENAAPVFLEIDPVLQPSDFLVIVNLENGV